MAGYSPTDTNKDKPNIMALMAPYDRAPGACGGEAHRPTLERPWFLDPGGLGADGLEARRAAVLAIREAAPRLVEVLRAATATAALTPAEADLANELGGWLARLEAEGSVLGYGESTP